MSDTQRGWRYGGSHSEYSLTRFFQWWSYGFRDITTVYYPQWMHYECAISDPGGLTAEMIEKGYLEKVPPVELLTVLNIPDLKEILKAHGLPVKGKKADLLERVKGNIDVSEIKLPENDYRLSSKGQEYLNSRAEILYAIKMVDYGISLDEYQQQRRNYPEGTAPREIAQNIFKTRVNDALKYNQVNRFATVFNEYARFLEHCEEYKESLTYYALNAKAEMSGCRYLIKDHGGKIIMPDYAYIMLPTWAIDAIRRHIDLFDSDKIKRICREWKVPYSFITDEMFDRFIDDIVNDNIREMDYYIPGYSKRSEQPVTLTTDINGFEFVWDPSAQDDEDESNETDIVIKL